MRKIFAVLGSLVVLTGFWGIGSVSAAAKLKIVSPPSGAIQVGAPVKILWQSQNFPKDAKVDINLTRQVSDNPRTFELVRQVKRGILNTGKTTWIPTEADAGNKLQIQIGCSLDTTFVSGCTTEETNLQQFSVVSSGVNQKLRDVNQANVSEPDQVVMVNLLTSLSTALANLLKLLGPK